MRRVSALVVVMLAPFPASAEVRTYVVDPDRSAVTIHVGRAGLFKFAGHEHEVLAPQLSGEVAADASALGASRVSLDFETAALKVSGKGEPADDVPKVQARMLGPELLDAARFPRVELRSTAVTGRGTGKGAYELSIEADLAIHGVKKRVSFPVHVEVAEDTLTASGRTTLLHSAFGLTPVSVAGVVKVKNEIVIEYKIVCRAGDGSPP